MGFMDIGSATKSRGIGTGYGREVSNRVTEVDFERASTAPMAILTIRYADRAGLLAAGVNLNPTTVVAMPSTANPFPGASSCPAPVGWDPYRG